MTVTDAMKRDWEERARKNAFHYIASWRKDWDPTLLLRFRRGRLPSPRDARFGRDEFQPARQIHGRSRLRRWKNDASLRPRVRARGRSGHFAGDAAPGEKISVSFKIFAGCSLTARRCSGVTDASADFTFSYLVLQHLPSQALATALLREILRTLKPGGLFLLQYNGAREPSMNWKGRAAWGAVNRLWSAGFHRAARTTASAMRLDPEMVGRSWHGISLDSADVRLILESAGGQSLHFSGENTPMAWCWGLRGAGDGL